MKRTTLVLSILSSLALASGLMADTVESIPFLATMSPANEVPPASIVSNADALIWVHVVRDTTGAITSGSVDFNIRYKFPAAVTVTGLHIHSGAAGTNGPILIPTDIGGANSLAVDDTGRGVIFKQVQFPGSPNPSLATIQDLIANPQNYYVNIHTTDFPGGAMRSQLYRADMKILMGLMLPGNEVPPTDSTGSGIPTVTAFRAADASGAFTSGWVVFDLNYTGFSPDTQFTGFHIHNGGAGVNGPVIINTGVGGGAAMVAAGPTGSGSLHYDVPVSVNDASFATEMGTVNGLFDNPSAYYINIHTTVFPGGVVRSQLRNTDKMDFQVTMSPANETPPITGTTASALAKISLYSIRNADGTTAAGTAIFDVNYRGFPAGTTFTGLHIHDGAAGVSGPVTINTGLSGATPVVSDTGSGNIYRTVTVSASAPLATLVSISRNPESAYVNLHTTVYPGGLVRSQLAAANTTVPSIGAVTSNPDTKTTNIAPGEIISIYGQNLAKYQSDLSGTSDLKSLPNGLNGVAVTIGGKAAPLYFVSPFQINAQVPFDVALGTQPVVVTNSNGTSTVSNITVVQAAPAIYFDLNTNAGAILKNSDYSLVNSSNPATANDILLIYLTGLGQTTTALQTGSLGSMIYATGPVSVTIGGQNAPVIYSVSSPGFAGLYQIAVRVPAGVTGTVPVVVTAGPNKSNSVNLVVR